MLGGGYTSNDQLFCDVCVAESFLRQSLQIKVTVRAACVQ